ncbi:MAG: ScpA family protein [Pseudomonadota bacterium]
MSGGDGWLKPVRSQAVRPGAVRSETARSEIGNNDDERESLLIDLEGFSGPLDLLLALARTQKVDLAEISVLELTEQYLIYIQEAQKLRLALAADYLVMAAWLTFLKSRLLLPKEENPEAEIPADELARRLAFRLVRLDAMRTAGQLLMSRPRLGQDVFNRGQEEAIETIRERVYKVDLYDLLRAYTRQRNQTAVRVHVVRRRVVWSIKDARRRLETMIGRIADADWVQLELCLEEFNPGGEESRTALAASFGASLEMAREGLVDLRQAKPFAPIYLKAAQRSEVSSAFVGDDRATEDEVPEEERAAKDGTS